MSHASRRIDVDDIRDLLTGRAADLTQHLLGEPNPDLSSKRELRFGNRGSLAVVITGKKAGSFFDHETEQGGDMLGLIQRERSCGFTDALKFARDFCGSAIVRAKPPHKVKQQPSAGKIVATYQYHDEAGAVLFEVVRFDPKDFRQRKPNGAGGWSWSVKGVKEVPYRLKGLIDNRDRVVVIVEGERDADNLWKLGIPATCNAGGAGNWKPSLNEFFHDSDIVVIPDNDPQKRHPKTDEPMFHRNGRPILPGQDHAQMVAKSLSEVARRVRVLELWKHWPDMPLKGDVSDWIENGGTPEALYELIDKTPDWSPPDEHDTEAEQTEPEDDGSEFAIEIVRLAKLPAIKYEQERKAAAEALGCRASVLDRLVQDERARLGPDDDTGMQGRAITFAEPELWPEPVDGAALLDDIAAAVGSHVVMKEPSRDACALWAAHTYLTDATMISPRLAITSPVRGCGKTTTLDVISQLVLRPLPAANISASAVFRVVEGFRPTLMIDEADSFLRDNEELRGVLNSGHRKGGAVLRTVGEDHAPRSFSTYGACAIALIGQLPGTLTDRSVPIMLTRRKRDEAITPFRLDRVEHLVVLARKLARWTADNAVAIAATEPEMPAGIYNRAADNWRPLLAIATVAGGKWLARGETAALASVGTDIDDASLLELLLGDIHDIFVKRAANKVEPADRIPSTELAQALAELEGRPWGEYGRSEKPITPGKLARLLKPLVIAPENIRIDDKVPKGYVLERFAEVFSRYLGLERSSEPLQRYNADETGTSDLFRTATADPDVADRKSKKPNNDGHCSGVADQKGASGEKSANVTYLGVEPFGPCQQCGRADGVVHHVRDNRHLGRPSANVHESCVTDWWAARQGGNGGDENGAAVCAHCGRPGGNEVFFSDGVSARLHRACETPYRQVLDGDE